jgi:hypothetical protein
MLILEELDRLRLHEGDVLTRITVMPEVAVTLDASPFDDLYPVMRCLGPG